MDVHRTMSMRALALNVSGALLVLAGIGMAAMNARGLINYRAAARLHGGEVVDLGQNAQPQPGQHGSMARVVSTPSVVEAPHDDEFNLRVNTPQLVRHVEMFQWREILISGGVHYEMDWVDRPLDASHFKEPAGHSNPSSFPISGKQFDAGLVQMGGFRLDPTLVHALPGSNRVVPEAKSLPENLAASFSAHGNYLVTSASADEPRLGDVRISWDEIPLQEVTVVGRLDGDRLGAADDAADGKGFEIQVGNVPLLDMFPDLPIPPDAVQSGRIISVLLASLGAFALLMAQRNRRDGLLALGLGSLVVGLVAGVLWIGADMQIMFGWAAVALLGLLLTTWRLRRRN